MCPPCARFRQVLGPPPRDPEGSVPAKLEDVRKKHAADVKEKNFQALVLHASSCVHHDEGDKSARDCQKMKVCDARGRGWPLAFFLTRTPFHFRFRVCLNTVLLGVRSSRAPAGSVLWWCRCWSGTHASVHKMCAACLDVASCEVSQHRPVRRWPLRGRRRCRRLHRCRYAGGHALALGALAGLEEINAYPGARSRWNMWHHSNRCM